MDPLETILRDYLKAHPDDKDADQADLMSYAMTEFMKGVEKRYTEVQEFESEARARFLEDYKFSNGDSNNHWQWTDALKQSREAEKRPFLTINKTRQHNLQIVNDARQNKPSIKISPVSDGASYAAAQAIAGICKGIEYHSSAQDIYDRAVDFMVQGGAGSWRLVTDYSSPKSFDQEIRIKSIADPLSLYIDPYAVAPDKTDMRYAFLFENMSKEEAKTRWPDWDPAKGISGLSISPDSPFVLSDEVIVTEYYRKVMEDDVLYRTAGGATVLKSKLDPESLSLLADNKTVISRPVKIPRIEWFLIVGRTVMEMKQIPGEYVPVVQISGEETRINGKLDRKSHTRALKDPQRMYNYWSSAGVEYGALQTKVPWIGPAEAFAGHTEIWENANLNNYAYLPYNQFADGQKLDAPHRVEPPVAAPVAIQGMAIAQQELMMASGQYQNSMGQPGNERTGKAITERQRQGDNATYHYINALALGIRATGKIILSMLPYVYDTKRVIQIVGMDSSVNQLNITPDAGQAYTEQLGPDNAPTYRALNPTIGYYEVQADVGPGYATQRQEAYNAFALILTQNPALSAIIGDIMFQAGDFPNAAEAAQRLKRMVPPQALGQGPTENEQKLMTQVQGLQATVTGLMDQLVMSQAQVLRQGDKTAVEQYKAFTERMDALLDKGIDLANIKVSLAKLVADLKKDPDQLQTAKPLAGLKAAAAVIAPSALPQNGSMDSNAATNGAGNG
jgi:hypothetical protein